MPSEDPESVVLLLGGIFSVNFQARESSYRGVYWTTPHQEIVVSSNSDPMYLPGEDSPDDRFFEARFSVFGTLVDVEGEVDDCQRVVDALTALISESAIVSDNVY